VIDRTCNPVDAENAVIVYSWTPKKIFQSAEKDLSSGSSTLHGEPCWSVSQHIALEMPVLLVLQTSRNLKEEDGRVREGSVEKEFGGSCAFELVQKSSRVSYLD
jgi:hypothetical protein